MNATLFGFAALLVMGIAAVLWIRALTQLNVPKNRGGYIAACVVALALAMAALSGTPGWSGGIAAGLAIFTAFFYLLTVAIGGQKAGAQAIQIGETIPQFGALDEQGQPFDSGTLAGNPALIKFFRGHW